MMQQVYPTYALSYQAETQLLACLHAGFAVWAPVIGADAVCRLQPVIAAELPSSARLTFLPVKKLLLPASEKVWTYRDGGYMAPGQLDKIAVIGLALCDLQAVWYLDQAFANDQLYQRRREQLLLVGSPCQVTDHCRCRSTLMPLAGDLFINKGSVQILSQRGETFLRQPGLVAGEPTSAPLPWPLRETKNEPKVSVELFNRSGADDIWAHEAERCLACGACSAVCPTCYCFDMCDSVDSHDAVSRFRVWDNCFFVQHGKVAGGFDFRAGRGSRLRFRLEHKRLGFGELRGQDSCVGCGRCRTVCPVDIDLDRIVTQLFSEELS